MKKELSISAAVLAVMIAGSLRVEAEEARPSSRMEKKSKRSIARASLPMSAEDAQGHVRIVPFFREGKAEGMKLYAMKPDSPLVLAGFRNGDVVRVVAGIEVVTPEACVEAIEKVRGLDGFDVEIERQGERMTLGYEVR